MLVTLATLGVVAAAAAVAAAPAAAQQESYYYCYHWTLSPGQVCRNPNYLAETDGNYGAAVNFAQAVCVDIQQHNGGSWTNDYPWACPPAGTYAFQDSGVWPGYAAVKNNGNKSWNFDGEVYYVS